MTHEEIQGAVARGWCSPENFHKEMDVEIASAIVAEIELAQRAANTGCANPAPEPGTQICPECGGSGEMPSGLLTDIGKDCKKCNGTGKLRTAR